MSWELFHFVVISAIGLYAVWDAKERFARQHAFGAIILFVEWGACFLIRKSTGDLSPIIGNAVVDIFAISAFAWIMLNKRAIWAALNVIMIGIAMMLHLSFFLSGQLRESSYLWALGILLFIRELTIFLATGAGRHAWGERLDQFVISTLRGWSWSGLDLPRPKVSTRTVA